MTKVGLKYGCCPFFQDFAEAADGAPPQGDAPGALVAHQAGGVGGGIRAVNDIELLLGLLVAFNEGYNVAFDRIIPGIWLTIRATTWWASTSRRADGAWCWSRGSRAR